MLPQYAKYFYELFKKIAFKFDPEFVHNFVLFFLSRYPLFFAKIFGRVEDNSRFFTESASGSLKWKFPIGVAAGLDKDGVALDFFDAIGFGAIEVGTVTKLPQRGNPRPRIFRHIEEESLRNSMGFPSAGMELVYKNIIKFKGSATVGVNIGKNKETPLDQAYDDYICLYRKFAEVADYIAVNLSSPNTPGLRALQSGEYLEKLLRCLAEEKEKFKTPIFIKISPDLDFSEVDHILARVLAFSLDGIIATNTTAEHNYKVGGISGKLLFEKSKAIRDYLLEKNKDEKKITIIGVGGFQSFEDCLEFWQRGGKFIQIYTSFIYKGPSLLKTIALSVRQP